MHGLLGAGLGKGSDRRLWNVNAIMEPSDWVVGPTDEVSKAGWQGGQLLWLWW